MDKQSCKVFCGGLSWETSSERLRAYFENYGVVREAFVSYNRNNGRPRGFGFVVFEGAEVADKVVAIRHTIDRREVECKKAVPKADTPEGISGPGSSGEHGSNSGSLQGAQSQSQRTRKIFVGGLAPAADEKVLRAHFEQFGAVEDAVVMYDHDNKRPRGFGFITFAAEESVDKVFGRGAMQTVLDKQIEIKAAVPRDQMPVAPGRMPGPPYAYGPGRSGAQQPFASPPYSMQPHHNYNYPPPPRTGGMQGYGVSGPPRGMQQGYGMQPMNRQPASSGRGGQGSQQQQSYGPAPNATGFTGPRAGYGAGVASKMQGMGANGPSYEQLYGLANGTAGSASPAMPFSSSNAQALYNLAGFPQQQLNGMGGSDSTKQQQLMSNQALHFKALGALAGLQAYGRAGDTYHDDATSAAEDYAAQAAAAAAAAAGSLPPDFNAFRDQASFNTAPAPGWSS